MSLTRFTLYYLLYSFLLAVVVVMLPSLFPGTVLFIPDFWLMFGFLAGITYIAYVLADFGMKRNPETGVMAIMGSIVIKVMFSLAFVLIYSLNAKEKGMLLVLNFFSLYLLFSFFEIYSLLLNLRHQNK